MRHTTHLTRGFFRAAAEKVEGLSFLRAIMVLGEGVADLGEGVKQVPLVSEDRRGDPAKHHLARISIFSLQIHMVLLFLLVAFQAR
jgi:hypothetical protein